MNLNTAGWASRVLTPLLRIVRSSPNGTVPVIAISEPVNSETAALVNADIALVAKGTGATLAQVPDSTSAGGSKRGSGATDWQKSRTSAAQVAGGSFSTIGGGRNNTASGQDSTVAGGTQNVAGDFYCFIGGGQNNNSNNSYSVVCGGQNHNGTGSGTWSFVGGGLSNTASSTYSFVGGGQSNIAQTNTHATVCGGSGNTASGQYAFVGGGNANSASDTSATVAGGASNTVSGNTAACLGGSNHTVDGTLSAVMGGKYGTARTIQGYHVFPACNQPIQAKAGVTQSALLLLGRETTNATATVLASNAGTISAFNQVILPNNSAYYFRGSVIAGVTGAGDSKAWTFEGAIKRGANAASTAIVGTVVLNTIAQNAGAAAWTVAITADTTNGGIAVTVTGAVATTIRWVAKIETTEMTY